MPMPAPRTARLLSPEEIAVRAGQQVPFLRVPERATVYAEREARLRRLAAGHPMRDYLEFVAELARVQQALLADPVAVPLPEPQALDEAARAGRPPLPAADWPRDPVWRRGWRRLVEEVAARLPAGTVHERVRALQRLDDDELERQADRLVGGVMFGLDLAAAPFVAAALQVHWTRLVVATQEQRGTDRVPAFGRTDDPGTCPCCGSRPTASIVRIGGQTPGQRYLHCSLCAAQWHMVRIKCTHCFGTGGIAYRSLEPQPGERALPAGSACVQAETCDACGHYLKIVDMGKDPHAEPVADDLASLTLDLLVAETGMQRHGVNLLLLFGDPEAPPS
jgi:FdhE protein